MMRKTQRKEGQAMVEYIIIVGVVALGALVLFGLFGYTIRMKLGGSIQQLDSGTMSDAVDSEGVAPGDSEDLLKSLEVE
jgi:hypothetical protein